MGKTKGNSFERWLSQKLSLWWTAGESDAVFWRTSSSGGRATARSKVGKKTATQYGDICAIDPIGEPLLKTLVIEAKKGYNKDTIHDILDKPKNLKEQQYETWITKVERDREHSAAFAWLIIHKRDRREALVFMPQKLSNILLLPEMELPLSAFDVSCYNELIIATTLDMFLEAVSPDKIKSLGAGPNAVH